MSTHPKVDSYVEAMQAAGVPHEALQVYDSCSWRRVGLAREYREMMVPTIARDGHPDIRGTEVLIALVAAFNAMPVMIKEVSRLRDALQMISDETIVPDAFQGTWHAMTEAEQSHVSALLIARAALEGGSNE
jgi:hypothetical protein